ncbi:MAG TPA: type II 3-dehydroquinate dehydratase [Methylophaga aminisulfidivorans]|uniref:3-dehydroquinate dehydratase n=1 Tax=Methylophaga aminisulfidivorans TaxID=230105 RepID=A0A7C1W8A2_9GAMM|nr:type II 3-dehydroquinate dehydratase [Methylophaga aminisulfidivorans]
MANIVVLNGPNLNLLGTREPEHYGADTLDDVKKRLTSVANDSGVALSFYQFNAEHQLIEQIHASRSNTDFIIINPAAFTHTSVALRDALSAVEIPFIEVHISNVFARETFRHHSYLSDIAKGVICGLGTHGYELALLSAMKQLNP